MEDGVKRTIHSIKNWEELRQFEVNAKERNRLTSEISNELNLRAAELGRALVAEKTGLDVSSLTPAEEKIVRAVSEYVAVMRNRGKYPQRTFEQLRNHGFIGAAEGAVCRSTPTQGYQTLVDEELESLSYEQIVIDHPDEFTPRAVWYSRKTLGLPVDSESAPAETESSTQLRTAMLIGWLKAQAASHGGIIPPYENSDAARVMGIEDMRRFGQVQGNIQSRIDFACYVCGLPPLGLTAVRPFARAWGGQKKGKGEATWSFPVGAMQVAAQSRMWTDDDFDRVLQATKSLPGRGNLLAKSESLNDGNAFREWAFSFGSVDVLAESSIDSGPSSKRNPIWSRDELILALDLYLRHRKSPPGKDSNEVLELSAFLNRMGKALGYGESGTYRNPNGVYMKMMNFRTSDPDYTDAGKVGLSRGNGDEKVVWAKYAEQPALLAQVVKAIRDAVENHIDDEALVGADEPEIQEAEEGRVLTRMHRYRERNRRLVELCKKNAYDKHGRLFCEACGFDFTATYGDVGKGLIDVHHTRPVHTLVDGDKTRLEDLVLLCSNCHRVVHSSKQWLKLDQLKAALKR